MKLKDGFVLNKVGGAYLAVAVGERADDFHALVRLNGTGAFLWNTLAERDCTREDLVLALVDEYGIGRELAERDIINFENKLRESGLLDETGAGRCSCRRGRDVIEAGCIFCIVCRI